MKNSVLTRENKYPYKNTARDKYLLLVGKTDLTGSCKYTKPGDCIGKKTLAFKLETVVSAKITAD